MAKLIFDVNHSLDPEDKNVSKTWGYLLDSFFISSPYRLIYRSFKSMSVQQNVDNLSEEAIEAFLQAGEILDSNPETLNERQLRDAISFLNVAVQDANAPFPRAEAILSMVHLTLGNATEAKRFANAALNHEPLELRAQLVKIDLALAKTQVMEGSVLSVLPTGIGAKYIFAAIFRLARTLFIGGTVVNSQVHFRGEIAKAIEIFQQIFSEGEYASEFLFFADRFITVADLLHANKFTGPARQLYSAVASVNTDVLILDDDIPEAELRAAINEALQIARGRA